MAAPTLLFLGDLSNFGLLLDFLCAAPLTKEPSTHREMELALIMSFNRKSL